MARRNAAWARAFHRQAASDFAAFEALAQTGLPVCHALHYLQMTTEKLSKAYRLDGDAGATPENVRGHTQLDAFVRLFFRSPKSVERLGLRRQAVMPERRKLVATALKIEKLAPAGDPLGQPRNTEYPWEVGEDVCAPIDEPFDDVDPHYHEMIRFLKLLRLAIADFEVVD